MLSCTPDKHLDHCHYVFSTPLDKSDRSKLIEVIKACVGTKFIGKWSDLACNIALDAVQTVTVEESGRKEIDIKRYAKVEKVRKTSVLYYCLIKKRKLKQNLANQISNSL
jgi:TCP-1/cpn60 chaperonin family.